MIETLLEVRNLSKTFRYRTGWFSSSDRRSGKTLELYAT